MRKFLLLFMIVLMLATPAIAAAQTTEPIGAVSADDDEVYRAYDNPDVYFDAIAGLLTFGSIYNSEEAASRSLDSTAAVFVASLRTGLSDDEVGRGDYVFEELEAAEVAQIGDESTASLLPFTLFESFEGEYGIVIVRQGGWVQVLIGFGVGEVDVIPELEALATAIESRWPSDEPITVREDGLRTGGIWDMTPLPEDLPDGFVIDEEFEEGPAATDGARAPIDTTPQVGDEATPVADDDVSEATPTTDREVPLIPVEMDPATPVDPEDSDPDIEAIQPVPTEEPTPAEPDTTTDDADETADDPDESAIPPSVSERLAPPFDTVVDIIIAQESFVRNDDGSCSGTGLVDALAPDGELILRDQYGDTLGVATVTTTGMIAYDMVLQQDICYMVVDFTEITARSQYVLVAGEAVIGRYTYEELTTGEPPLVVIGAE